MEDRLEYLNRLARGEVSDASVSTSDSSSEEDSSDEEADSEDEEGVESRRLEEGAVPMGEATRYATYPKKRPAHTTLSLVFQCRNTQKHMFGVVRAECLTLFSAARLPVHVVQPSGGAELRLGARQGRGPAGHPAVVQAEPWGHPAGHRVRVGLRQGAHG